MSTLDTVFNLTAAISLAAVAAVVPISIVSADILLPENARWQDRFTFGWLVSRSNITQGPIDGYDCQGI